MKNDYIKKSKSSKSVSEVNDELDIGEYLTLGPVGTALLPYEHPRALLIDEIDKGNPDLANDLLDLLEEGYFRIPELARLKKRYSEIRVPTADGTLAKIIEGDISCLHFPFVVLTSNNEREFSQAFRRRCLHLTINEPSDDEIQQHYLRIIEKHLPDVKQKGEIEKIIARFIELRKNGLRTTDQLLQAVFLLTRNFSVTTEKSENDLLDRILTSLN
jgi:MoxR-like ATPase